VTKQKIKSIKEGMKCSLERIINNPENFFVFYYNLKFTLLKEFPISAEGLTSSEVYSDLVNLYKHL